MLISCFAKSPGCRQTAVLCTVILCLIAACSPSEPNVVTGNRTGVLHYGTGSEVQTLDPHIVSDTNAWEISSALFEGLVRRNAKTLEAEPGVAESWTFSEDQLSITFKLNPNARWSNGDPVTAQDFVWSWQRSLSPNMGNILASALYPVKNAEPYNRGEIDDPEQLGVKAIDRHTLKVTLENPTPHILGSLAMPTTYPVHRATVEKYGTATQRYSQWTRPGNMVNNGPFKLADWKMYRHLRVERNEAYWDTENVALNAIVFRPIDSQKAEEHMFRARQLHVTFRVPINKIPGYRALPQTPYVQAPLLGSYYYLFNITQPVVNDINVRKALSMALDREQIVSKVLLGLERPSASIVPPGIPGYETQTHTHFDLDKARHFLAAAGYPNGKGWPGLELVYNTAENHRRVAVAMQQMWKDNLNIDVTLANQEWKVYLDTVDNMQFSLARMGWIGGSLDPGTFLGKFTTRGGTNRTGFSNARYDQIIEDLAPAATTLETRYALLAEAETLFMQEFALIPIFSYYGKHLVQPSVKGYYPNVLEIRNFKNMSLDASAPVWEWPADH
mgnify:FL=1